MPLGVDNLDGEQLRQAAKLLERENERLIRQVLELKQKLASAEGKGTEQLELLADLEQQLAARNRKLFGDSSEKRGSECYSATCVERGGAAWMMDIRQAARVAAAA